MSLTRKGLLTIITSARSLVKTVARVGAVAIVLLLPFAATAEPIQLKLSFFGSDHTNTYRNGIKPFVDAVNAEGKGLLAIEVYPNGALGRALAEQPRLVLDGIADIAWIVPGQTPYRFPDNELLEQPGLFRDTREGSLAYTRLIAANELRGYQDFFVIGAYTSDPTIIHSRKPIESLAALKGQKIRANNPTEAETLERLGAMPTVLEASKLANAIGTGSIDGAAFSPTALFDFGVSPVATNHYLLRGGAAPLVLVMNRKTFDGLPEAAKALIRKYSGERAAATWIESFGATEKQLLDKLKSDPERKVVEPSPSDLQSAQRIYRSMIDAWTAKSARNRQLSTKVETEIATIRSGQ
jgi:TRAP-type C4-dicarboxylate transport system substrate-binding protein